MTLNETEVAWYQAIDCLANHFGVKTADLDRIEQKSLQLLRKSKPFAFLLISGPSGVGKGTIEETLMKLRPDIKRLPNVTTRASRPGEIEGVDYHFISQQEFGELDRQGAFIVKSVTHGDAHGMIKRDFLNHIQQRELFLIDKSVNSTKQLLAVPDVRKLKYLTIFVLPPSFHELERRLKVRSSDDQSLGKEQVIRRLARAAEEVIESISLYDVYTVNDEVVRVVDTINKLL